MKTSFNIGILLASFIMLFTAASCEKPLSTEEKLCKEWHCRRADINTDIYVAFHKDGTFEEFTRKGEGAYRLYRGTWVLEGKVLSGQYNDGEPWAAAYSLVIAGKTMTLTSLNEAAEESIFTITAIPQQVRDNCVTEVKSPTSPLWSSAVQAFRCL